METKLDKICLLAKILFLTAVLPMNIEAQYGSQYYLPLRKAEMSKRFVVRYIGTLGDERPGYFEGLGFKDKQFSGSLGIGISGANVRITEKYKFIIDGKDVSGKEWRIHLPNVYYACRFYETDLDHNGLKDVILIYPTGGNGLSPTSFVFTITFDQAGRPVPFAASGYFEETNETIFDLVDLNRNGQAELVHMEISDGYWVTNLYESRGARWHLISGRFAGRNFPMYTRFTLRPNRRPVRPRAGRNPTFDDLSNAAPTFRGRIESFAAPVDDYDSYKLTILNELGGKQTLSVSRNAVLVEDNNSGRAVKRFTENDDEAKRLFNSYISDNQLIDFYGEYKHEPNAPLMLWIRNN